jgi:FAD/FMN-containing dehydrogenase
LIRTTRRRSPRLNGSTNGSSIARCHSRVPAARSGELGVGYGKIDFLNAEHGEAISVMRAIKNAIDPDKIMNPGKILRI